MTEADASNRFADSYEGPERDDRQIETQLRESYLASFPGAASFLDHALSGLAFDLDEDPASHHTDIWLPDEYNDKLATVEGTLSPQAHQLVNVLYELTRVWTLRDHREEGQPVGTVLRVGSYKYQDIYSDVYFEEIYDDQPPGRFALRRVDGRSALRIAHELNAGQQAEFMAMVGSLAVMPYPEIRDRYSVDRHNYRFIAEGLAREMRAAKLEGRDPEPAVGSTEHRRAETIRKLHYRLTGNQ